MKTLRYWVDGGLLEAERSASGYRLFDAGSIGRVGLIRGAQALGFSLREIRSILELRDEGLRPCEEVRRCLALHLASTRERVARLRDLQQALEARLAWAQEHPEPRCNAGCVYLGPEAEAT